MFPPPAQLDVSPPFLFVASFFFTRRAPPPEGSCSAALGFCPSARVSHPFQRDAATHCVVVVRPCGPAIGAHVGSPHARRGGASQERKFSPARVALALPRPRPASFEGHPPAVLYPCAVLVETQVADGARSRGAPDNLTLPVAPPIKLIQWL